MEKGVRILQPILVSCTNIPIITDVFYSLKNQGAQIIFSLHYSKYYRTTGKFVEELILTHKNSVANASQSCEQLCSMMMF